MCVLATRSEYGSEEEELVANGGESWFTEEPEENPAPDTGILTTSVPAGIPSTTSTKLPPPPPTRVKVEDLMASRNKQGMFEREDSERMDPEDEVRLTWSTTSCHCPFLAVS